jgi:hypothetical protein
VSGFPFAITLSLAYWFVVSGFPFTHNGGAAPTRQAATGHKKLIGLNIFQFFVPEIETLG